MRAWTLLAALLLAAPGLAAAGGIVNTTVDGNTVEAEIALPGGLGADVTITFESAVGLSPAALGLSAFLVSPTDTDLLSRLPAGSVGIPAGFPVVLRIEPSTTSPLSFSGTATVELYTHALTYTPMSPLRLFKAPLAGEFVDITAYNGMGSYRVGGSTGGFSEFLIGVDERSIASTVTAKFGLLQDVLDDCALPEPVASALQDEINDAWIDYSGGLFQEAADGMDDFVDVVEANAGSSIPNVWRATRDLTNCAGTLVERAATLRFSLNLAGS